MKHFPLLPLALALLTSCLVSCSSVQSTMNKVGTPMRAALTKVGTPVKSAISKARTPVRSALTKVGTPVKSVITKARTPMKTTVTKVSNPVKSSLARLRSSRFKLPSFLKKTPPVIPVREAQPQQAIAKKAPSKKYVAKKSTSKTSKRAKADALAWNRKKKAAEEKSSKIASKEKALVPKDIDPSDLDLDSQVPGYGVLPSLGPDLPPISDLEEGASLPADIANLPAIPSLPVRTKIPDLSSVPEYLKPAGPVPAIKSAE